MTLKKFWKRVNALLHDNRTVLREGEDIEDWEEVQRQQREEEAKQRKKEREILSTWFLREEYLNAGWFKRFLLRIEFVFRDTRGESHIPQIPDHIRMGSPVVFCPISLLTLSQSKDKESLQNGKHSKKPRKRKRAGSRDLAPKQRQIV